MGIVSLFESNYVIIISFALCFMETIKIFEQNFDEIDSIEIKLKTRKKIRFYLSNLTLLDMSFDLVDIDSCYFIARNSQFCILLRKLNTEITENSVIRENTQ